VASFTLNAGRYCRPAGWASESPKERGDRRAEVRDVDEKRVMALWRIERNELDLGTADAQALGDLFLLGQRKQDVGGNADDERALDMDALQRSGDRGAVARVVLFRGVALGDLLRGIVRGAP
jgi:hypothetical protein